MFFRRPKLTKDADSSSMELLQDALEQYGVSVSATDGSRELRSLRMDDIDLLEAIQLVEAMVGGKVDRTILRPSTTLSQVASSIDETRTKK